MTIITQNDKLYQLVRTIRKEMFPNLKAVKMYEDYVHAEHTLQDAEHYMFCKTIDDVEFEEVID